MKVRARTDSRIHGLAFVLAVAWLGGVAFGADRPLNVVALEKKRAELLAKMGQAERQLSRFRPAVEALRAAVLAAPDNIELQTKLLDLCAQAGTNYTVPALSAVLEVGAPASRKRAVDLLAKLFDVAAVPGLRIALRDSDSQVRTAAAIRLAHFGQAEAIPPLVEAGKAPSLNDAVFRALLALRAWESVPFLMARLPAEGRDRLQIVTARDLGDDLAAWQAWWKAEETKGRLASLVEALRANEPDVRVRALAALLSLDDQETAAAFVADALSAKTPDPPTQMEQAADALLALGYRLRLRSLQDRNWESPRVQAFIAQTLSQCPSRLKDAKGGDAALKALTAASAKLAGAPTEAVKAYADALTAAYKLGSSLAAETLAQRATAIGGFAMFQKNQKGQYDEAIEDGWEALTYFREAGLPAGARRETLYFLGQTLRMREAGREQSIEMMEESARLAVEANNDHRIGGAFYETGYMQNTQGRELDKTFNYEIAIAFRQVTWTYLYMALAAAYAQHGLTDLALHRLRYVVETTDKSGFANILRGEGYDLRSLEGHPEYQKLMRFLEEKKPIR